MRYLNLRKMIYIFVAVLLLGLLSFWIYSMYKKVNAPTYLESKNTESSKSTVSDSLPVDSLYISPISIDYLRGQEFNSPEVKIEQQLSNGSNYKRYIASYESEGYKIYGLLTIPNFEQPSGGYSAVIFNHGYIPPAQYKTTEKYVAYVDYLARSGFVVFKIDMRGHDKSEGAATGSYFSSAYTIDALSAVSALSKRSDVNANKIGMWGHSMAGNLTLRAMEVSENIKAGVIWAGAVYSYSDFAKYRISDNSYAGRPRTPEYEESPNRENSEAISKLRGGENINYSDDFWKSISLTANINYLNSPLQIHHAVNDPVVDIGYSRDLADVLKETNKDYELFEYVSGGHNIDSPYFEEAMQRTVEFFKENL